jgi:hypothetical protein
VASDTAAAYIEVVRPDIDPVLIAPEGLDALARVGQLLPGAAAHTMFGFECNLSRPEPVGDLALYISAATGRHQLAVGIPAEVHDHPVWRRVVAFLDAWRDPRSLLFSTIDHVWLEFDVSTPSNTVPAPNIFHGYRQVGTRPSDAGLSSAQRLELSRQVLAILTERELSPPALAAVRSGFERLPPGAEVAQAGAMIARDTDAFRLCARLPDLSQVGPFLDALGWDGERGRLDDLLRELRGRIGHARLDLDVAARIRPKIGIECYLEAGPTPHQEQWAAFVAFLTANDIASEAKCQALLCFPGHADERWEGGRWPPALRRVSGLLGTSAVSVFVRRIHHVKLGLERGLPIEAKAYLSVRHLWVTPDRRE